MKSTRILLVLAVGVAVAGCRTEPPPEVVVTPDMEKGLLAGFDRIVLLQNQCADIQSFLDCHTTQAQAAMAALDQIAEPGLLDPSLAGVTEHRGALWVCLIAHYAGFTRDRTTVVRHTIDPRSKLARVVFRVGGYDFGFPMARQDGTWRSPFPGQVVLAVQYASWVNALKRVVPADKHEHFEALLSDTTRIISGYQPNWALYPELGQVETDDVQLKIRQRLQEEAAQNREGTAGEGTAPAPQGTVPTQQGTNQ